MFGSDCFHKTLIAMLVGFGAAGFAGIASAQSSQPSAKATFAASGLKVIKSLSATGSGEAAWQPVLTQQIKMANQKDLFISPALQCGIVTDTTVKSLNGSDDIAEARGTVRVRVKVTGPDGKVTYAAPYGGGDATGATDPLNASDPAGIVYCDRVQTLRAKFSGLNCKADLQTGAVTCADPEELQLILKTMNANAFHFVAPNLISGTHTVEVQARNSAATSTTSSNGSLANANAFIGAGSVAVEAVRMINGELVEF